MRHCVISNLKETVFSYPVLHHVVRFLKYIFTALVLLSYHVVHSLMHLACKNFSSSNSQKFAFVTPETVTDKN